MKYLSILVILFTLLSCNTQEEKAYLFSYFTGNGEDGLHLAYSTDGLTWEALNNGESYLQPEIGKDKLMRDPCIIQGPDNLYHMVWTTGWWDKHIGYANSADLIHWSDQIIIPVMDHETEARNSWAPEIYYDESEKEYFIFWATTIPGKHSAIAETEREKDLNHRMYATSTKDFVTFKPTFLFFNTDFSVIDATIYEKDDEFYMFVKNENPNPPEKNIRITKSNTAQGPYPTEVSEPITGNYWAEGPTPLRIGEYTYVYFDKYIDHKYGAVRSTDMVNWEDVSESIQFPSGTRHGTAFTVSVDVLEKLKKSKH